MHEEFQNFINDLSKRGIENVNLKSLVFRPDLEGWIVVHDKSNSGKPTHLNFNDLKGVDRFIGPKNEEKL